MTLWLRRRQVDAVREENERVRAWKKRAERSSRVNQSCPLLRIPCETGVWRFSKRAATLSLFPANRFRIGSDWRSALRPRASDLIWISPAALARERKTSNYTRRLSEKRRRRFMGNKVVRMVMGSATVRIASNKRIADWRYLDTW